MSAHALLVINNLEVVETVFRGDQGLGMRLAAAGVHGDRVGADGDSKNLFPAVSSTAILNLESASSKRR